MVRKISFDNNDYGISESLGSILLLAVILVLSTIIAAYVFGVIESDQRPNFVAVTVDRHDTSTIEVTNYGGDGVNMLDAANPFQVNVNGAGATLDSGNLDETVGSRAIYNANANSHVVIVARFSDNSQSVIYDDTV